MPQIARLRRPLVDKREVELTDKGDLCYIFTKEIIIPLWKANPRWDTISTIRVLLKQKPDLAKLKAMVRGCHYGDDEILNQAAMAYEEFYDRFGRRYEDAKAKQNGDVYAGLLYSNTMKENV